MMNNNKSNPKPVRVRFAPSPTGLMHIGGLRTALYDWILARKNGGQFILRIEDTDRARYDPEAEKHIKESLKWLRLDWDEGPDIGGPYAPYTQSQRLDRYADAARQLIHAGVAYEDDTQAEELEALRQRQRAAGQPTGYDNRGRYRTPEQIQRSKDKGLDVVVRLKVPDHGEIEVQDSVRGTVKFDLSLLQDFVILKSDGFPTYHLAHIVDDHDMGITHIIRGLEWMPSLPRHVLIHEGLGIESPTYVHVPLILGKDRSKLSKRHGAHSALEYRDAGYVPDAVFNYLALLGWSTGDDSEIMSREEIISRFTIDRVLDHPAIFDSDKLDWMNGVYIRSYSDDRLTELLIPILESPYASGGLPDEVSRPINRDFVKSLAPVLRERIKLLTDVTDLVDFFFVDAIDPDPKEMIGRRMDEQMVIRAFELVIELCEKIDSFSSEALDDELRALAEQSGMKAGQLFTPIRVAVTGKRVAPPLFETLQALGREKTLTRLKAAAKIFADYANMPNR